jgi:hypothetical protein
MTSRRRAPHPEQAASQRKLAGGTRAAEHPGGHGNVRVLSGQLLPVRAAVAAIRNSRLPTRMTRRGY